MSREGSGPRTVVAPAGAALALNAACVNILLWAGEPGILGNLPVLAVVVSIAVAVLGAAGLSRTFRSGLKARGVLWSFGVLSGAVVLAVVPIVFARYVVGIASPLGDNAAASVAGPMLAGGFLWAAWATSRALGRTSGGASAEDPQVGRRAPAPPVTAAHSLRAELRRGIVDIWSTLLAVFFSVSTVVGVAFDKNDSATWFTSSVQGGLGGLVLVLWLGLLYKAVLVAVFLVLDRLRGSTGFPVSRTGGLQAPSDQRQRFWPAWGILLAGWLPWLLVHAPGNVDSDTISQLFQCLGLAERTDHHPWFDTVIFGWFWTLGDHLGSYTIGLFVFLFLQEILTAAGMALLLCQFRRLGLHLWIWSFLVAFVAFFPLFAIVPSVMSKDSFAGVFWIPFLAGLLEILRTRGAALSGRWLGPSMIVLSIGLILSKRTNLYLVAVVAVLLFVVLGRRWHRKILLSALLTAVLTMGIWPHVVLPALSVKAGTSTDMLTIPLQQTARVAATHGADIDDADREAIDAVLGYDGLAQAYNPRRSDAVKGRWKLDATRDQKTAFARTWLELGLKYPGTYISATVNNTYEYFAPITYFNFQQDLDLSRYIPFWEATTLPSTSDEQVEAVALSISQPEELKDLRTAVDGVVDVVISASFLSSKAFYASWLPLLLLTYALRRREWLMGAVSVPFLVNLAFLVASPIALPRYVISLIYAGPAVVAVLLTPQFGLRGVFRTAVKGGFQAA